MRKLLALALVLLPTVAFGQAGVQLGAGQVFGNSTASRAPGKAETVTAILDRALGSTRGSILERGASGWGIVAPGTSGKAWVSNGAGADPAYQTLGISGGGTGQTTAGAGFTALAPTASSAGTMIYWNGTTWVAVAGGSGGVTCLREDASGVPSWGACDPILNVLSYIPANLWASIADCSISTDLTTYLNTAIAAANNRALRWPKGCYTFASTIGQSGLRNTIWQGEGGQDTTYAGNSGTVLKFTGTGSGSIVNLQDHRGVWIKDLQLVYTSNSFTGTGWNMSSTFSTGNASGMERVSNYQITNNLHTADEWYYLKNNVDVTFRNIYVAHANYGWVGLFNSEVGTPETNIIKIEDSTSIALRSAAIVNPVIGWKIINHNFELGDGGIPSGILCGGTYDIKNLTLVNSVFADSTAAGTWISCPNNVFGFKMYGGGIFSNTIGTGNGISLGNTFSAGITISNVLFSGLATAINIPSSWTGADISGNNFLSVTTPISGYTNLDIGSSVVANNPGTANYAGQIQGTATNDNARAGAVGEYNSATRASGSALSISPANTTINVTSMSLAAGDWDVSGSVTFVGGASLAAPITLAASVNTVSATTATGPLGRNDGVGVLAANGTVTLPVVATRLSLSATTTVYLTGYGNYTGSGLTAYGGINARRVR